MIVPLWPLPEASAMVVAPAASFMGHWAATVGGGGGDEDPVRDRLSAWKLSPALAPVWVILNPTVSPVFLAVRVVAGRACQVPVPVTHPLTVFTDEPPEVYSCSIRQMLRPEMPTTSPAPCSCAPAARPVAGLG